MLKKGSFVYNMYNVHCTKKLKPERISKFYLTCDNDYCFLLAYVICFEIAENNFNLIFMPVKEKINLLLRYLI